jgi:hypothetical protein
MLEVTTGTTNYIMFISRYNQIDKIEFLDHNSKVVYSEDVTIVGMDGKMQLTGITFNFKPNLTYTFKAYFKYNNNYYLATQQLIRSWKDNERVDNYIKDVKKNTFINYDKK